MRALLLVATLLGTAASCAFCAQPLDCIEDKNCPAPTAFCVAGVCRATPALDDAGPGPNDAGPAEGEGDVAGEGEGGEGEGEGDVAGEGEGDAGEGEGDAGEGEGEGDPVDAGPDSTTCDTYFHSMPPSLTATDAVLALDPDGAGGNAPFDVYCRFTRGHGWGLVLRDDPATDANLALDAFWDDVTEAPLNDAVSPDLAGGDARFLAYWRLPVQEILGALDTGSLAEATFPLPPPYDTSTSLAAALAAITAQEGDRGVVVDAGTPSSWIDVAPDLEPGCRTAVVGAKNPGGRVRLEVGIVADGDTTCEPDMDSYVGVGGDCNRNDDGAHLPTSGSCTNPNPGSTNLATPRTGWLFVR